MMAEDPVLVTNCRIPDIATTGPGTETGGAPDTGVETVTAFLTVTTGLHPQTTTGLTMTKMSTLYGAHRKIDTPGMM